jgi:Major Facilitator Superfamily/Asp/Glu/Hydantoin racemase
VNLALAVIATAQLMVALDLTIVTVAPPHIQAALGFSGSDLEWVVNAYAVTFGGLLLLGGRSGDLLERRRAFIAGLLVFVLASLLGAPDGSTCPAPSPRRPGSPRWCTGCPTRRPPRTAFRTGATPRWSRRWPPPRCRVGLLGTRFTMEPGYYRDRLEATHRLKVLVPTEADRALAHRIIYEELVQGVTSDASRMHYLEIIGRLIEAGAEGVIADCTEIELLVTGDDAELPYFPTAQLHAKAAVDLALAHHADLPFRRGRRAVRRADAPSRRRRPGRQVRLPGPALGRIGHRNRPA